MAVCTYCEEPAIANLDGEDLCERHANEWVHSEGAAAHEAETDRRARGVRYGDEN